MNNCVTMELSLLVIQNDIGQVLDKEGKEIVLGVVQISLRVFVQELVKIFMEKDIVNEVIVIIQDEVYEINTMKVEKTI